MSWKRYQNELIVAAALLFALFALSYKGIQHARVAKEHQQVSKQITQIKKTIALKRIWGNKKIAAKVNALQQLVPASKTIWRKEGRKLHVTYKQLDGRELNKVITKFLNVAVQIEALNIEKKDKLFHMELTCKW